MIKPNNNNRCIAINSNSDIDDGELLARFLEQKDKAAFDLLVRRHHRNLYGYVWKFVGNHADADEVCQQTFIQVFRKADSFVQGNAFKPWLFKIAENTCKNFFRAHKKDLLNDGEEALEHQGIDDLPEARVSMQQEQEIVQRAIAKLPAKQRMTLLLRINQGYKFSEIAELMGCPLGTAKANFHHAMTALKKLLEG